MIWLYEMFLTKAPELEQTHSLSHQEVDDMGYILGKCNQLYERDGDQGDGVRLLPYFCESPVC